MADYRVLCRWEPDLKRLGGQDRRTAGPADG